ncbi:MAG: hypothetical protein A2176_14615 [Spirochaetes bacterium RBG_13_51_14]|nr:MAG: hypothetical protein A2176_14615 [Spirochaetes bacterium RBG_13_51_14]
MSGIRYTLRVQDLAKKFNSTLLFKSISFSVETGGSLCVTGPNGSGKSTLLKILAGIMNPTGGAVSLAAAADIPPCDWMNHIGYTGPLVNPYDDLTGLENIQFVLKSGNYASRLDSLLRQFNLTQHRDKLVKHYSSGMKQRLRLILAVLNDPPVLILDEPGTNLDAGGREALSSFLDLARKQKIIVLATNEPGEEKLCGGGIRLG